MYVCACGFVIILVSSQKVSNRSGGGSGDFFLKIIAVVVIGILCFFQLIFKFPYKFIIIIHKNFINLLLFQFIL